MSLATFSRRLPLRSLTLSPPWLSPSSPPPTSGSSTVASTTSSTVVPPCALAANSPLRESSTTRSMSSVAASLTPGPRPLHWPMGEGCQSDGGFNVGREVWEELKGLEKGLPRFEGSTQLMDEYFGKRAIDGVVVPRKGMGHASRDTTNARDRNAQEDYPRLSVAIAGDWKFDVYMGIDVFGNKF
ncbi:hypothetical protein HKD37_20G055563 [Glycine soja]